MRVVMLSFSILALLVSGQAMATDILITKDTTVNDIWKIPAGSILKFSGSGHINGTGIVRGGIIDAALTQWIFETSLTLYPEGTYGNVFSAKWFGAGYASDNYEALQKGINTVLENNGQLKDFFIPKGVYDFSQSLTIKSIYKENYVGATIHIFGEGSFWDCCDGTTLNYTATDGFALGLQLNKGTEIDHLIIKGMFEAPSMPDPAYYNLTIDQFNDAKGKCGNSYAGIIIDYDGSKNKGGSTGVKIHDVYVGNFTIDYLVSPNGQTFNADILLFENIRCEDAKVGFASGQAQEKGNVIRGIYSWGNIHTLYSSGRYGKRQAGNYLIDGGNVAGHCIRLFDISQAGWYSTTIQHIFAERIGSIGTITSQIPTGISNCTFHFAPIKSAGQQTLFYSNNNMENFNNCIFRYYGSKEKMKFGGTATYNNCFFSGPQVKK